MARVETVNEFHKGRKSSTLFTYLLLAVEEMKATFTSKSFILTWHGSTEKSANLGPLGVVYYPNEVTARIVIPPRRHHFEEHHQWRERKRSTGLSIIYKSYFKILCE